LIGFLVNSSLSREEIMDYFTLDLMVLLLSWHHVAVPQQAEKKLINRLFESLIKRCYHDNRAILKNNLELLKTMTEAWRELIDVPVGLINNFMTSSDDKKIATGIQLFGLVLSNSIECFDYPHDLSSLDFYKNLIACMKHNSKTIHASSAEVVGMLLKKLDGGQDPSADEEVFNQVLTFLFDILSKMDISLFITCVHRIQLNYPPISERCMAKLVHHLPKLYGEFKLMCAESILSSIKTLKDPLLMTVSFLFSSSSFQLCFNYDSNTFKLI
jgi:DNA-dependent protein kinase catalytic subunit